MKRALFLFNYRGGSCLFNFLNGCPVMHSIHTHDRYNPYIAEADRLVQVGEWQGTSAGYWLNTKPSKVAAVEHIYSVPLSDLRETQLPLQLFGWWGNVGDWWGDVANHNDVPGPYDLDTFYRFGPQELQSLGDDWKIVYLVRDGRNQVESMRRVRGGIEEEKHRCNPEDYFQVLCKGWRNRARIALDCAERLSHCRIFHFEDLVANPTVTMRHVYDFLGLELDLPAVQRAFQFTNQHVQHEHSSFSNQVSSRRWAGWSQWELDTFRDIAGKELVDLGYEKDDNWKEDMEVRL